MRECGECTACCEGWVADESLDMRAGKPCAHCTSGGCAIYETRPEDPCRTFKCAWLEDEEAFPEEMRPDKSGAILIAARHFKEWDVMRASPVGAVIPDATLEWLRLHTKAEELPLVFYEREFIDGVYTGGGRQRAFGSPEFAAVIREAENLFGRYYETVVTPDDVIKF